MIAESMRDGSGKTNLYAWLIHWIIQYVIAKGIPEIFSNDGFAYRFLCMLKKKRREGGQKPVGHGVMINIIRISTLPNPLRIMEIVHDHGRKFFPGQQRNKIFAHHGTATPIGKHEANGGILWVVVRPLYTQGIGNCSENTGISLNPGSGFWQPPEYHRQLRGNNELE